MKLIPKSLLLLTIFYVTLPNNLRADCTGCCSSHGGVVCIGGVTMCKDETPLSDTCSSKGCNECPEIPITNPTPNPSPVPPPVPAILTETSESEVLTLKLLVKMMMSLPGS